MDVIDVELVEDQSEKSTCLGGFLKLRRLLLRNVYADGTRSAPYKCDVMSRTQVDAVAVVLYQIDGARRPLVMLKEGFRPAVVLRRDKRIEHKEEVPVMRLLEIAAGVLEAKDGGDGGIERRAADEAHEECGMAVDAARVVPLGGPQFPSPGVTDERVHYRAVEVDVTAAGHAHGDGSPMEHGSKAVVLPLGEAIARCRSGAIPDMKTEVALLRLADAIGFLPQLGCFRDELPPELAARWRSFVSAPEAAPPRSPENPTPAAPPRSFEGSTPPARLRSFVVPPSGGTTCCSRKGDDPPGTGTTSEAGRAGRTP